MQKKIVSLATPVLIGIMALALGWFAHAAVPLSAQGIVVEGHVTHSDPAAPSAPAGTKARLTYQGRLTNIGGAPINTSVNVVFKLYDQTLGLLWTSATRTITPTNGLFTVYLGDGTDPDLNNFTLPKTASIGVTVGSDAEMTPRQALNTVIGHSDTDVGVVGSSISSYGVIGTSDSLYGVLGISDSNTGVHGSSNSGSGVNGRSTLSAGVSGYSSSGKGVSGVSGSNVGVVGSSASGNGVYGYTSAVDRAGVSASNAYSTGIALEISNGGIKASGAGVGTSTFAFIHQSSVANINFNVTRIDNALTNGDPDAMLFVTHVYSSTGVAGYNFPEPLGVYYDWSVSKWSIYLEHNTLIMPVDISFNVMVIKR